MWQSIFVNINENYFLYKGLRGSFSVLSAACQIALLSHEECSLYHSAPQAISVWDVNFASHPVACGLETHFTWFLTKSPDSLYHFIPGVMLAESVELSWPGYDLYICCTACCSNFRTGISQWPWHAFCSLLFLAVLMNTSFLSKGSRCGPLDYPHGWWLPNSF